MHREEREGEIVEEVGSCLEGYVEEEDSMALPGQSKQLGGGSGSVGAVTGVGPRKTQEEELVDVLDWRERVGVTQRLVVAECWAERRRDW